MRVLVAEDDLRLAGLLVESLADAGWQTSVVHDGRAAYEVLLRDSALDVALLDWTLPGLDGVTIARGIRAHGRTTPILMLTARGGADDRVHALAAGADDYLSKPFNLDELLDRLQHLGHAGGT